MGQEAVNVAKEFHDAVGLTGLVLTKMDGDARGGAALSMKSITQLPIKFIGTGEKVDDFEIFYPDRIASRILGMGDVVSLVERAQETIDEKEAQELAEKMRKANFNFEDMLKQFRQVKKMGSLGSIMNMLPGMNNIEIGDAETKKMDRTEAIILSMTPKERQNPAIINGSRRRRIADGSGVQIKDVNQLIKQQTQMNKMMKKTAGIQGAEDDETAPVDAGRRRYAQPARWRSTAQRFRSVNPHFFIPSATAKQDLTGLPFPGRTRLYR